MHEAKTIEAADIEPTDYKAAVIEYIKGIDSIRQEMAKEQEEVERLKVETREILARLEAA